MRMRTWALNRSLSRNKNLYSLQALCTGSALPDPTAMAAPCSLLSSPLLPNLAPPHRSQSAPVPSDLAEVSYCERAFVCEDLPLASSSPPPPSSISLVHRHEVGRYGNHLPNGSASYKPKSQCPVSATHTPAWLTMYSLFHSSMGISGSPSPSSNSETCLTSCSAALAMSWR
jgi:hypothetical protein